MSPMRWFVVVLASVLATLVVPSAARAARGEVQLVDGRRLRGDVQTVSAGDRVAIVLEDGTLQIVPWSEVRFVLDGTRIVDAAGNSGQVPPGLGGTPEASSASPSPGATAEASVGHLPEARWGRFRPPPGATPETRYRMLPSRRATRALHALTAILVLSGVSYVVTAATDTCGPPTELDPYRFACADRPKYVGGGFAFVGLSLGFEALAIRRSLIDRAAVAALRRLGYRVGTRAPILELTATASPLGVAGGLRLRF